MCVAQHTPCVASVGLLLNIRHACRTPTDVAGTGDNKGGKKNEGARLVKTLAIGSVWQSTQKTCLEKWTTWVKERKAQGKGPWLNALDGPHEVLNDLLESMASPCFVHNNHQPTVRGYLEVIKNNPQNIRRMRTTDVLLHDFGSGKDRLIGCTAYRKKWGGLDCRSGGLCFRKGDA